MRNRFAAPVASAAIAIMALGACSDDDGPTTLARGEDIDFVGSGALGDQTMDISAEEEDGEVTGEVSFEPHGSVADFQCADTVTDGVVRLAGQFTTAPADGDEAVGAWMAFVIREGDPDSVSVPWFSDPGTESCDEALDQLPDDAQFYDVEDGDDIETG